VYWILGAEARKLFVAEFHGILVNAGFGF